MHPPVSETSATGRASVTVGGQCVGSMVRPDRVLVVEDHPDMRVFSSRVLEHAGYSVVAVGSLAAAEAELGTATVDVVVTDLKLPQGSGLDVLAAARRRWIRTPS